MSYDVERKPVYEHTLDGSGTIKINIPKQIDRSNISHIELRAELFGSQEAPTSEREKGYHLFAFIKGNQSEQYLESFSEKYLSENEILEISGGVAKFLGVELKETGVNAITFDEMNTIGYDWKEANKPVGYDWNEVNKPVGYDWNEVNKPVGYDWNETKKENTPRTPRHPAIEKYTYEGTNVLRNWFDEKDPKQLRECETFFSGLRIKELIDNPIEGKIDFNTVKATHAYIFQDVYPDWAGEERSLAIGKKEPLLKGKSVEYAPPGKHKDSIKPRAEKLFENLEKENNFKGLDQDKFTEKLSGFMTELWQIHPFMEGNTRTTMVVCNRIATEAGYPMSLPFIDKVAKQMRDSLVMSTTGDKKNLEKILTSSVSYELSHKNAYSYDEKGISLTAIIGAALTVVSLLFFGASFKTEASITSKAKDLTSKPLVLQSPRKEPIL